MTKTITREQIKEKLDQKESISIIEALPKKYFDEYHLPGAVNINHDEIRQKAPELLPDKEAFIIVYCADAQCENSRKATAILDQMGYVSAFEYVEGKKDWKEANLPVESTELDIAI